MVRLLFVFSITIVAFSACKKKVADKMTQTATPAKEVVSATVATAKGKGKVNIPANVDSNLLVSFQRTACFGKCPAYKMEIFKDGKAKYQGFANIPRVGSHEAKVTSDVIKMIQKKALDVKYFELANQYPTNGTDISDIPKAISYVRFGNDGKMIVDNFDAPKELIEFEKWLETLADSFVWKEMK